MARHVPRRQYAVREPEPEQRRLTDIPSVERVYRLKAALYSLAAGVLGGMAGAQFGGVWAIVGLIGGWATGYFLTVGLMQAAGAAAGTIYAPSGKTTPAAREYSEAQALAAQGLYHEAVAAYEIAAAESEGDPTPYLAIARIQREYLQDYQSAAAWFRRARRDAILQPGQELLVAQELIELYRTRLGEPRRAIPELARIPQIAPGTPQAEAAEREIAAIRATLRDGGEPPG